MTTAGVKQLKQLVGLTELRSVSLPDDVLLTNWAEGELRRASPEVSVETRYHPDYGLRIVPASPGMPRAIYVLSEKDASVGSDGCELADYEK